MDSLLSSSLAEQRFAMTLLSLFAALALTLSAVGIYGVLSYLVSQRTSEIGVRITLGAQFADVVRLVVAQGMFPALAGIALGLAAAFGLSRFMSSLLFGVSATDPWTFAAASLLLAAVALTSCLVPAFRAARLDPVTALRYE